MTILSLISINLEYGGELTANGIKYAKDSKYYTKFINQYIKFIKKYDPDIIAFQEIAFRNTYTKKTTACNISNGLNYHYYESKKNELAIASKYPIIKTFNKKLYCGVEIKIDGEIFRIFNLHLNDEPCAYYSLHNIPYNNTPTNLTPIKASKLSSVDKLPVLQDIMKHINNNTFILGDFNEPSHLDWNENAVKNNIVPCSVKWQISSYLHNNNFIDIVRKKYKCNIKYPMNTCDVIRKENIINPPVRIDFIYTNSILRKIQACNITTHTSDHLPIFVKVVI
jgi:exonuclease III